MYKIKGCCSEYLSTNKNQPKKFIREGQDCQVPLRHESLPHTSLRCRNKVQMHMICWCQTTAARLTLHMAVAGLGLTCNLWVTGRTRFCLAIRIWELWTRIMSEAAQPVAGHGRSSWKPANSGQAPIDRCISNYNPSHCQTAAIKA